MSPGAYQATLTLPPTYTATTALDALVTGAATVRFGVRPNLPNQTPLLSALADIAFQRGQAVTVQTNLTKISQHYSVRFRTPL